MDEQTGNTTVENISQLWDVEVGPLITAALMAVVIVVGLWMFNNYLLPVFTRELLPKRVARFRQRISVATWLFYFALLIFWALRANAIISGILLALMLAVGWNIWRDLLEGAIFKLQARATVGDSIIVHGEEGKIEKTGLRHISLRTLEDRTLFIPYRELSKDAWQKTGQRSKLKSRSFELKLADGARTHADDVLKTVEQCPWTIADRTPEVSTLSQGRFKVEATTLDQQTFEYLVEYVMKRFG